MADQQNPQDTATHPPRRRGLRVMPINKMIPNMLTLGALAAGMSGIQFALNERWEAAAFSILVAAILDTLDGRVARLLKGTSKFGAELDSLSDFICFGVAPAMILYLWALENAGRFGWFLAVLFAMCCAMRLARFNTMLENDEKPVWAGRFFTGVPAPAGAGLVLLPMVLSFQVPDHFIVYLQNPYTVSFFLLTCGGLFVSTLPTFSFKNMKMARAWMLPAMIGVAVLSAFIFSHPWLALTAILGLYLASFPLSIRSYLWHKNRATAENTK
ncbi:MAG: phosphatidylcholine/phosphatidylserine synthase [Rhodospirillaceae bacterium]